MDDEGQKKNRDDSWKASLTEEQRRQVDIEEMMEKAAMEVVRSMNDLPIIARIQFARNVLLDRGGNRGADADVKYDPLLQVAAEVLAGVKEVLRQNPQAAVLGSIDLDRR